MSNGVCVIGVDKLIHWYLVWGLI